MRKSDMKIPKNFEKIKLKSDGVWYHGDTEITHKRTVDLFFKSVLYKNGKYFLTGEKKPLPIEVEDVAFFVKSLKKGKSGFEIELSDQTKEILDITTIDMGPQNQLYCLVKDSTTPARFERKVYYQLMKSLSVQDGYYGLVVDDVFYPLQSERDAKVADENLKAKPAKKKAPAKKSTKKKKATKKKSSAKKAVKKKKTTKKKAAKKKPVKKKTKKKKR